MSLGALSASPVLHLSGDLDPLSSNMTTTGHKRRRGSNRRMATSIAAAEQIVAPIPEHRSRWDRRTWILAIPLAVLAVIAFLPALGNGFVEWDDINNFVENPYYRGLGATQLEWAWSTFWVGVYQPLGWWLYEAQYAIWNLDPHGYHFISLLLHAANVVVLYVLTLNLLARSWPEWAAANGWACDLGAGLATAIFAVHPLRVETVAWASCQTYLPSALFFMLAVLTYLLAFPSDAPPRRAWLVGSFFCFGVAVLFKAVAVTLPVVLLILDVYPLRRFAHDNGRGFVTRASVAVLEKVPFFGVSFVFMALAIFAKPQSWATLLRPEPIANLAQACYGSWFYIQKTMLPLDLICLYPFPRNMNWLEPPYGASILATVSITVGVLLLRRRWPALLAGWVTYLAVLAPNSGIIRNSTLAVADRYSYVAMLGLVVVAAAGLSCLWKMALRTRVGFGVMTTISLVVIVGLIGMSWSQCRVWRDSETLFTHAMTHGIGTNRWAAHSGLGVALKREGKFEGALYHLGEAARLDPGDALAANNYAFLMATCPDARGRDGRKAVQVATRACELTQWQKPRFLNTLAAAYAETADFALAVNWQTKAIELLADERQKGDFQSRLRLYQSGKAYREAAPETR